MTTYYVRTPANGGDDGAGDGSTAHPWATISKALATVAAGDTVNVGAGTYAEDTGGAGYLNITQVFASTVTVQSEAGAAAGVIIQGASDATYNTLIAGGASKITFSLVTFGCRLASNASALHVTNANNITFNGCVFTANGNGGTPSAAVLTPAALGNAVQLITFSACTFNQSGASNAVGLSITGVGSRTLDQIALTNCAISVNGNGISWSGFGTARTVTGGTVHSEKLYGMQFTNAPAVTCTNVTFTATTAHCIIVDANVASSNNLTFTGCTFTSAAGAGFCALMASSLTITNCTLNGANYGLLLGRESGATTTVSGTVSGITATASTGHGALLGIGVSTLALNDSTINGGDYGLALKECTGVTVDGCRLHGGTEAGLYFKAADNSTVQNCIVDASAGTSGTVQLAVNDVTGNTASGNTLKQCHITARGSAALFNWLTTGDGGGNVCDYNTYRVSSGAWGSVLGTTIASLAELRAAWAAYGDGSNDSHSHLAKQGGLSGLGAMTGLSV